MPWAADVIGNRLIGDSNDDGVFNSSDLVRVFQAGEYQDGVLNNSTFDEGDWNQDGDCDSSDIVFAFQTGNYVVGVESIAALIAAAVDSIFAQDENLNEPTAFVA